MRIRNLYNPVDLKDYPAWLPWCPNGTTATSKTVADGMQVNATGSGSAWLNPPYINGQFLNVTVWETADGLMSVGALTAGKYTTIEIPVGKTIVVKRICGLADYATVRMLAGNGIPTVFSAADHPY